MLSYDGPLPSALVCKEWCGRIVLPSRYPLWPGTAGQLTATLLMCVLGLTWWHWTGLSVSYMGTVPALPLLRPAVVVRADPKGRPRAVS